MPEPTKQVQKWADVAMWKAPEHVDPQRPQVTLSYAPGDPLGLMAMVNEQYTGTFLTDPSQATDEQRRKAWEAGAVSLLSETPMEWFQVSLAFENVSRAFTHQLVRTRMATYAQESMRFAVKENVAESTKLPPSLAGTIPDEEFQRQCREAGLNPNGNRSREQRWRHRWDYALDIVDQMYAQNVDDGMPAEDARGLLPTNILTRIHMRIDIKTLLRMAGSRLCTQAQFEWRGVFAEVAKAFRTYGASPRVHPGDRWQFDLIAASFRPVCFAMNRCPMKASSDRACSIRGKVDAFEAMGTKSHLWEDPQWGPALTIHPAEWLADPTAARVAPGGTK